MVTILHCKPLGIGKLLSTFQHEAPRLRFDPATSVTEGEHCNHYITEPPKIKNEDTNIILVFSKNIVLLIFMGDIFVLYMPN